MTLSFSTFGNKVFDESNLALFYVTIIIVRILTNMNFCTNFIYIYQNIWDYCHTAQLIRKVFYYSGDAH